MSNILLNHKQLSIIAPNASLNMTSDEHPNDHLPPQPGLGIVSCRPAADRHGVYSIRRLTGQKHVSYCRSTGHYNPAPGFRQRDHAASIAAMARQADSRPTGNNAEARLRGEVVIGVFVRGHI